MVIQSFLYRHPLFSLALVAILSLAQRPAAAQTEQWAWEEGGLKDRSTGIVWGVSLWKETGSMWTWDGAMWAAENWVWNEYDESGNVTATYDDWRVPTIEEFATAANNGTLDVAYGRGGTVGMGYAIDGPWTANSKGNKAYIIVFDVTTTFDPVTGERIDSYAVADPPTQLFLKGSGLNTVLIRGGNPPGKGRK